jgi:hypothetical protein
LCDGPRPQGRLLRQARSSSSKSSKIIVITCLDRLRSLGRSLDICSRMLGLEWLC